MSGKFRVSSVSLGLGSAVGYPATIPMIPERKRYKWQITSPCLWPCYSPLLPMKTQLYSPLQDPSTQLRPSLLRLTTK